jgi:hypothetical protein
MEALALLVFVGIKRNAQSDIIISFIESIPTSLFGLIHAVES